MPFLEEIDSSLWTLSCHPRRSTSCPNFFQNGWSTQLTALHVSFFGRALGMYMEGSACSIGNVFALTRTKVDSVYAIFGLSILPSYPSGVVHSLIIQMPHWWALLLTTTIEGKGPIICTFLWSHVSPFWRGVLRRPRLLLPVLILLLGMDVLVDFRLIIGWVMILLSPNTPTYLCSQRILINGQL